MIVLALCSNASSDLYPNNEAGHFQTLLPHELRIEGSGWMVGLARIQIPRTWSILVGDDRVLKISKSKSLTTNIKIELSEDNFISIKALAAHINTCIQSHASKLSASEKAAAKELLETRFDLGQHGRIYLTAYSDVTIQMSEKLQHILGLNSNKIETDTATRPVKTDVITEFTKTIPDINHGYNLLWVYSDIIEEQIVSDTKAPLLSTVKTATQTEDNFLTYEPKTIDWLMPSASRFQTITSSIHDINGRIIPFQYGEVVITLHIVKHGPESNNVIE